MSNHSPSEQVNGNAVDLSNLRVVEDTLLFDTCTGKFHTINASAAFIFAELKRSVAPRVLVSVYADKYDLPQNVAERDIELFLNDLSVVR